MNVNTKTEFKSVPSTLVGPLVSSCLGLAIVSIVFCILSFAIFKENKLLFSIFSPVNIIAIFVLIGLILLVVKNPGKWKNNVLFDFNDSTIKTTKGTSSFSEVMGYRALQSESLFSKTSYQIYLFNSHNKAIPFLSLTSAEDYTKAIECLGKAGIVAKP